MDLSLTLILLWVNSPKACFRELFSLDLLNEGETVKFLEMTDDRNMTSHTYKEEVSQIIYSKLPDYLTAIMDKTNGELKELP